MVYSNANAVADEFTYTVVMGLVEPTVPLLQSTWITPRCLGQARLSGATGSTATLSFAGIPGYSYRRDALNRFEHLDIHLDHQTPRLAESSCSRTPTTPQPAGFYRRNSILKIAAALTRHQGRLASLGHSLPKHQVRGTWDIIDQFLGGRLLLGKFPPYCWQNPGGAFFFVTDKNHCKPRSFSILWPLFY